MTTYKTVTLSPPAGGGTLDFTGTDANERILFTDPHNVGFDSADLNLGGGNDLIPDSAAGYIPLATVSGGTGDDNIALAGDFVTIHGGGGNDHIEIGADTVGTAYGDAGNDVIFVEGGGEGGGASADGGAGDDKINLVGAGMVATGGEGNDLLTGDNDSEDVLAHGGNGNDTLVFASSDLALYGDAGNDQINAQVSSTDEQFLYGGTGNDTIRYTLGAGATVDVYGGAGKDQLYAGAADDVLHFLPANSPAGAGRDVVHCYQHGQDHIALDGGQHYQFVGETKDPGAGEVGFYHQGQDTIVDGFDGKTHFEVQLQGFHGHLDASDFIA